MKAWTWDEVQTKIERDLDLQEESFITPEELLGYCNEAIDEAEGMIHDLHEDYFLSDADVTLVADQSDYDLPSDIFAQRIRRIQYDDGTKIYQIKEIDLCDIPSLNSEYMAVDDDYHAYKVINTSANGVQIRFYPTPPADKSGAIKLWYIRNAKEITATTDVIDIPEFMNFVIQHIKVRCYEKDKGNPSLVKAIQDLERERELMIRNLSTANDDGPKIVMPDFDFYDDHT